MNSTTSRSARIVDLAELRDGDDLPSWAAIYSPGLEMPFVLSPRAMRWSDDIFLSRPAECRGFWLAQKKKLRCKLGELFAPLLRHHYGEEYIAVLGMHPWQCLWYLEYQRRQQASGLYLLQSPLDRNIYRGLDWESWFALQQPLADHLEATGARDFRRDRFASRQAQMRRFIERAAVAAPGAMKKAEAHSIQRRFGSWLGRIWQWSFSAHDDLQRFPWRPFAPRRVPAVERDLEYPVNQWAYVEVLLREDLARLGEQLGDADDLHINRMTWRVGLFNEQSVEVELSFRHPYSLHRDRPGFATALYQARYLFDDLIARLRERDRDLDLPASMPFTHWRLEVCERVALSPLLWDLFGNDSAGEDFERVMSLQNKLPLAFECYRPEASFYPEQSFAECIPGDPREASFDVSAWSCGAANKPLFFYSTPEPIDNPERMQKIFLERSSEQWWLDGNTPQSMRDYYILKDCRGRLLWAYRTRDGAWFKQGEYH